jgi:tRNA uridine 5-carboxymethylaminomethyl modification enzyme
MIDDLVTRGVTEPYRMFTSRAEYRLRLRADNADQRLTGKGIDLGCVGSTRARAYASKAAILAEVLFEAGSLSLTAGQASQAGFRITQDGQPRSLKQLLSHPEIGFEALAAVWPEMKAWPDFAREQIEIDAAYHGYMDRQDADVALFRRDENLVLPSGLDYSALSALSNEVREKLAAVNPTTVGQAARIEGVTPGAIVTLLAHVRRRAA